MKLLVRATNWVGDAVMSIPALRAIREGHPGAEIAVLARHWVAEIYQREDFCDRLLIYENTGRHAGMRGRLQLASELRELQFDCAILLQNAFDAALIAWLAGIPRRIGYARDGRGFLLTDAIPTPERGSIPAHQRYYYLELLRRAGFLNALPKVEEIHLHGDAATGGELFRSFGLEGERVVGISPGAAFGSAKRWLPERFAESAGRLATELGAAVAIFGSQEERELCALVAADIQAPVKNFAGETSLAEFIDLAAACRVYLTNDSGAMHIASALGVPTVAVFGATNHLTTGPTGSLARVVREPVECSPCLKRECPIDHRCMTRVDAARVAATALELLK